MGDMADAIIDGLFDEQTGELIDGEAPGYPRTMEPGHYNSIRNDKYQPTERQQIGGVLKYLKSRGITDKSEQVSMMKEHVKNENATKEAMCLEISQNFGNFIKFINNKKKK